MLSRTKYLFITLLFTVILHTVVFSQKLNVQNIEHITLKTDRTLYISGEPVWYSAAYSIQSENSIILSKVLYVELFNNKKQVLASQKIAIDDNIITGRIIIPEHVPTGYYILRAYTRYQENFPAWQFTSVILSVVNPQHPLPKLVLSQKNEQSNIALMPDGNIAYRIKESSTNKIDSVKLLVNSSYVTAKGLHFSNGLGSINYNPKPNDNIELRIMLVTGDSIIVDSAFAKIPTVTEEELQLLSIRNNEGVILAQDFHTSDNEMEKPIIATDSVLSGNPIYINILEIDSTEYPIIVSLVLKGTHPYNSSLLPNYLIENPLYILDFLSRLVFLDDELINQAKIAIALKQKNLNSLFNKEYDLKSIIIPELSGLTIQGKIINPVTNKPVQNDLVYASLLGDEPQFHASTSKQDGTFLIPFNFCNNHQDIFIATNNDNSHLDILIDDGYCPTPPTWSSVPFIPDTSFRELITQMYLNNQIASIFDTQLPQITEDSTINKPIFGDNLTQIKLSDYIRMSSTPEVFNELVPNVKARKKDGQYTLVVFDDDLNIKYENPLVLVDNMPYNNINKIMELQPTEIEQIDVINHEYLYGNNLFKGIIMITTNTGNFAKLPLSQGGVFVEYQTLSPDIEFIPFSSAINSSDKPNFTNTAYWQSFNYNDKIKQIQITAPSSIAEYDLFIVSMANQPKIIELKTIIVNQKQMGN